MQIKALQSRGQKYRANSIGTVLAFMRQMYDFATISASFFRGIRILLLVVAIIVVSAMAWNRYTHIPNRNAYINGNIVPVTARINGTLTLQLLKPGMVVELDSPLGRIENTHVSGWDSQRMECEQEIQVCENEIASYIRQKEEREALLKESVDKQRSQESLEKRFAQERVKQAERELAAEIEARETARIEAERQADLLKAGAAHRSSADLAASIYQQTKESVHAREAQVLQMKAQLEAANLGLQLDGSKTPGYHAERIEHLRAEIAALELQKVNAESRQNAKRVALTKVMHAIELETQTAINAPVRGVVWNVLANTGEQVHQGQKLIEILETDKLWVETFVSEEDASLLFPGAPAHVRMSASGRTVEWDVLVKTIRGGVGRLQIGESTVIPPPELIRREAAVQLVPLTSDTPMRVLSALEFYGAGRTVEVSFQAAHTIPTISAPAPARKPESATQQSPNKSSVLSDKSVEIYRRRFRA